MIDTRNKVCKRLKYSSCAKREQCRWAREPLESVTQGEVTGACSKSCYQQRQENAKASSRREAKPKCDTE